MRKLLLCSAAVVLFLTLSPTRAQAQIVGDGDVFSVAGISDGCGDTMNPDDCMSVGNSWSATICTNEACPACGFDSTMTRSICYRLIGNYGYCSCQGGGVGRDKYGNKIALCTTNGSCASHR